jgi:uncharacterized protein (DUF433 family)
MKLSNHLTFDPYVSHKFPRIRGSWVTTDLIVRLIDKRWTLDDINMFHPEIKREDVMACLSWRDAARRTAQRKGV